MRELVYPLDSGDRFTGRERSALRARDRTVGRGEDGFCGVSVAELDRMASLSMLLSQAHARLSIRSGDPVGEGGCGRAGV